MLKAGLFDDFKGAKTLVLWGDEQGMAALLAGMWALRHDPEHDLLLGDGDIRLTVRLVAAPGDRSHLRPDGDGLQWECSGETLEHAEYLVRPLLNGAGQQYLDVSGQAEQVIISRDEYPADLR